MNQSIKKKNKKKSPGLTAISDVFAKYKLKDKGGYITQEFQDFGYRMAIELEDTKRVSLYMRLAKRESRGMLEKALSFISDANARNKAALFMWKLKQLKEEKKELEKKLYKKGAHFVAKVQIENKFRKVSRDTSALKEETDFKMFVKFLSSQKLPKDLCAKVEEQAKMIME